jgi:ComF family protein
MFKSLINLFFPDVCAGCNELLLTGESVICTGCRHNIPLTGHHLNPENEAFMKFYGKLPVEFAATMCYFHKKGIVQDMIHKLKYKGHEEIGTVIGSWYGQVLKSNDIIRTVDEIIPVPLHPKRLRKRGYNQVTAFGKALAENLGIPYNDTLLLRHKYAKTQTKKDLLARALGDQAVFAAEISGQNHDKHYLVIDDVLTTGSTLQACGHALLQIPGTKISVACIAMSHS